ncbi:MAG: hypothetical protein JXX14_03670, partial [Deltaproteobacteria bacterium]|nr:hypothetical protein [Deltaproteobacteria bacterium]
MTYGIRVSAPGKLFLSGEYAVLEGAEAVIDSVGRRVWAIPVRDNIPQSLLLRDVSKTVAAFLAERAGSSAGQLPNIEIDSTGFSIANHKLGIGSSAAVAASATGALFEWAGLDIDSHREMICEVATAAHRAYQKGKGSGADVATSVYGGTIIFSGSRPVVQSRVTDLNKVFVWTGKPASTVSLMEKVRKLHMEAPDRYREVMMPMVSLAGRLASAYRDGESSSLIDLTRQYGEAMAALGNAASVPIVTDKMTHIADIA